MTRRKRLTPYDAETTAALEKYRELLSVAPADRDTDQIEALRAHAMKLMGREGYRLTPEQKAARIARARSRLTPFDALMLDPVPVRGRTESQPSANARVLRAWRRGRITLTVTRATTGGALTPEQIDWTTLPATSGPSGAHATAQTRVTLSARGAELLAAVRSRYASDSAAVEAGLAAIAGVRS